MTQIEPFRILIVDDDPENRELLAHLLSPRGYAISVAATGEEALALLKEESFDLILLDVLLPGISGYEVCETIKRDEAVAHIPVLFITAMQSKEEKVKGFRAGGEDYITKPYFKEEILARVRLSAERSRALMGMKELQSSLEASNQNLEQKVRERTSELEALHGKLVIQEKMASMGQLSAGLAHEINNPIHFLRTNFSALENYFSDIKKLIELYQGLKERSPDEDLVEIKQHESEMCLDFMLDDLAKLFEESQEGFDRISWLVKSMRSFAGKDRLGVKGEVDLNQCVMDTHVLARNEYKYHATISLDLGEIPSFQGYEQQIKQVILNLVVNAAQALASQTSDEPGQITIKTLWEEARVIFEVIDNGPGIPPEVQPKIFDPFFSTKGIGKGVGLGLSLCYDYVVSHHGGSIDVLSQPGHGCRFRVSFPCDSV